MLRLQVPELELFDETTEEILFQPASVLVLEHSLASLSKWESIWKTSFINTDDKTTEQTISYIKCMNQTPDIPDYVFENLTSKHYNEIEAYITDKATATTFGQRKGNGAGTSIITAEIIYYWMVSLNIPLECEHWHLNKLIALIEVCDRKNSPNKKMSKTELAAKTREINERNRAKFNTRG